MLIFAKDLAQMLYRGVNIVFSLQTMSYPASVPLFSKKELNEVFKRLFDR